MSKMNYELCNLLRQVSGDNNGRLTHHTYFGPEANWSIEDQHLTEFWTEYCRLVDDQLMNQQPSDLCLAEIPPPVSPLVQDFIFKYYDNDDEEEPYSDLFLAWVCYCYQQILIQNFECDEDSTTVVVLESEFSWLIENDIGKFKCYKVRIQFPNARIDTKLQETFIRKEALAMFHKLNLFNKLTKHPVGDWDVLLQLKTATTPVVMHGSITSRDEPRLKEIHFWKQINKAVLEKQQLPTEVNDINDLFQLTNHEHIRNRTVNKKSFIQQTPEYCLPLYLSMVYGDNTLLLKQEVVKKNKIEHVYEEYPFGQNRIKLHENEEENIELAEILLTMISPTRYSQESMWLDIGKSLYYITKGGAEGLSLWTKQTLSNNAPFDAEQCRQYYDTFGQSFNTIKTLGFFAREDNKKAYEHWHQHWCLLAKEGALSCLDSDVAESLYRTYWLDFTYDVRNNKWYQFGNFGWVENARGINLRKTISHDFMRKFEESRAELSAKTKEMDDKGKADSDKTEKYVTCLIAKLKTSPFKKRLMEEAQEKFANENFSDYLNKNPNVTGVKNGVLEIVNKSIVFRSAKPEDYITMCSAVHYNTHYDWKHHLVVKCMTWFSQVFSDESLLHYFLKFSASFLKGRNSDKIFVVFTGVGDNSKSMIIKLFESTFGRYVIKMNVAVLSEKSANSGNASPQMARAAATRGCFLDEADDMVQLNKAAIKRMTGGDRFYCRKLHDNGDDVELTFKTIMSTNEVPAIPTEKAIKNRVRIMPFLNQWVDDIKAYPPEKNKQFFQKNVDFEQEIPSLAAPFLWILTQYYHKYAIEGLKTPDIVVEYTDNYWRENDYLGLFISEMIQEVYVNDELKTRDSHAILTLNELNEAFRFWYKKCYPNRAVPDRDVIRNELNRRWGKNAKGWPGLALIKEDAHSLYSAN